ncbi:glycosyl hydrolase family 18 protein [Solicola sp. PLA-1-18]|uniref:glycosyl hydrolase family 18 protein n=1 Tax=Solicola sp. PLA-1-18 TaxID=3380532 RepID=UPI003B7D3267
MRWRTVLVAVLTAACALMLTGGAPVAAEQDPLAVTGYAVEGDAAAITRDAGALTTVGVDGVNISATGRGVGRPTAPVRALRARAHREGLRTELLVANYSDAIGDFDPVAARRLLGSDANRRRVARRLAATVRRGGWDGVQVDLESLGAGDRRGLTRFVAELRRRLPADASLSMAVMASTSTRGYRRRGYDLPALARRLDRVVLMAYDQHGPTWSGAGPVGGLPWVRRTLRALLRQVPARQVDLGVAGYGYTWPKGRDGTVVSDRRARKVAHHDRWDARQGEWTGRLAGGGRVWWSDARSWRVRRELASSHHLHGLALWSLGRSDPLT